MVDSPSAMPIIEGMGTTKVYFSTERLKRKLEKRGITNAHALAEATGLTYPTARIWWSRQSRITRIDAHILKAIATFLDEPWCDLLELVEETTID
jgi:transcriptional regulator with XRE-family HTH domain